MAKEKELSETDAYNIITDLFGEDSIRDPDINAKIDIIKTCSPELDRAIGVGGWPRARLIQLAGKEASGKTFMALMAMANWQSHDPENCCAFIDAEFTYDPRWAGSLGIDNDRVFLIKSNDAEAIFTGLLGKPKKNKTTGVTVWSPGLLEMIKNGQRIKHKVGNRVVSLDLKKMGVIVLDSTASMLPPIEMDSEVGKQNIAGLARFLSTELRKLTPAIATANVAFIAINQVRVNIGQFYGDPETSPGGKALKHACSLIVEVGPMGGADNIILDANEEKIGHRVRAKVTKNKLCNPARKAEFLINFMHGLVETENELLNVGVMTGIIERPNNVSYIINDEKISSREKVLAYIKDNFEKLEEQFRDFYLNGKDKDLKIEREIIEEEEKKE
jgi:recombination protein RecA